MSIKITAKIDRLFHKPNNSLKATATAFIGGAFAVHGIRVMDSQKGVFVAMPSTSYNDKSGKTQYSDVFHAITAEARTELLDTVKEAYEKALEEAETESESEDEDHSYSQSM